MGWLFSRAPRPLPAPPSTVGPHWNVSPFFSLAVLKTEKRIREIGRGLSQAWRASAAASACARSLHFYLFILFFLKPLFLNTDHTAASQRYSASCDVTLNFLVARLKKKKKKGGMTQVKLI